jgi:fumarate hydratase class II
MCRKSTIPHPNRQKNKQQTKNTTAPTNKHVAAKKISHPEKKKH